MIQTRVSDFKAKMLTVDNSQAKRQSCKNILYEILLSNSLRYRWFKIRVLYFPPLKILSQLNFFVQINILIVSQLITMPTNDVTMNVKILVHILPCLQNL